MTAPDTIGSWQPVRMLAGGARTQVWLATQEGHDDVVLKISRAPTDSSHMEREVGLLQRAAGKGIPAVREVADDFNWVAMERVEGLPIDRWAAERDIADLVAVAVRVVDILERLHGLDIVHGDIKPSNLLVDSEGQPTLIDLGIATEGKQAPDGFRGTFGYAAPEVLKGNAATSRSDVYGLGAVLYTSLVERTPFIAPDPAALAYLPLVSLPGPPASYRPEIPAKLSQLLLALLARDVRRRPGNLERVRAALIASVEGPPATPLLGMHEVRESLRRAVVGAADHEGRVFVLYGPPGSGRRSLIAEAVEYGRREGLAYLKGSADLLARVKNSERPCIAVVRGKAGVAVAAEVLASSIPALILVHAERPMPALASKGAHQATPPPLSVRDVSRLARFEGVDASNAELWWRQTNGLPAAIAAKIRAEKRGDGEVDLAQLPKESRKILSAITKKQRVRVSALARALRLGEHTLLDHCEVLFAEGLIVESEEGISLAIAE